MSKADLLQLLDQAPHLIAVLAVVAVLALYEMLAPNGRGRPRQALKRSAPELAHAAIVAGPTTVASSQPDLKSQSPKVLAFDRSSAVGVREPSVASTDKRNDLTPPKTRDFLMVRSDNNEPPRSGTKGQTMTVEKQALELAATLEEGIARGSDTILGITDTTLVARALRLLAAAAAEVSGDQPLTSLDKSA